MMGTKVMILKNIVKYDGDDNEHKHEGKQWEMKKSKNNSIVLDNIQTQS